MELESNNTIPAGEREAADAEAFALLFRNAQEFRHMQYLYNAAVQEIELRLKILSDEFAISHDRNPIHHIESRVKSVRSIVEKLKRLDCEISVESARRNLNDIGGIRVVTNYIDDVYRVEDMLMRQTDIELIKRQDYIETPNHNGYSSLHLDVRVPIYLSEHTEYLMVEIQIRSVAMDFWASLEHDLRYKANKELLPPDIGEKMWLAAREIADIDAKMQEIYYQIRKALTEK